MSIRSALVVVALLAPLMGACAKDAPAPVPAPPKDVAPAPLAEVSPQADPRIATGVKAVESFFGAPFAEKFKVEVSPHRADFNAYLQKNYGWQTSECWMVASGVADGIAILDPAVWQTEACEHDGNDAGHVQRILTHELVHVFHGQKNPTRDFTGMDDLGWFCEGLACYASGQLLVEHAGKDVEAARAGVAPKSLATAWSGKYRYAVSGSLVRYVDERFGREMTKRLLAATKPDEFFAVLGISEEQLLADWKQSLG